MTSCIVPSMSWTGPSSERVCVCHRKRQHLQINSEMNEWHDATPECKIAMCIFRCQKYCAKAPRSRSTTSPVMAPSSVSARPAEHRTTFTCVKQQTKLYQLLCSALSLSLALLCSAAGNVALHECFDLHGFSRFGEWL